MHIYEWKDTVWWRILRGGEIRLYCYTDKVKDAKSLLYPGESIQRMQTYGETKRWRTIV